MKTTVVNIHCSEYDVYIGRAGKGQDGYWGNPIILGKDGDRQRVLSLYWAYFRNRMIDDPEFFDKLQGLIGKRLGCFCVPKQCHGHAMAEYLNIEPKIKPYVDQLISAGFSTFSSCDGGEGHQVCKNDLNSPYIKRFIRISPTRPTADCLTGFPVHQHGSQSVLDRFIEFCNFVEQKGWTYCTPRLIWSYSIIEKTMKSIPNPFFELRWN